jgi:hypothetical protein
MQNPTLADFVRMNPEITVEEFDEEKNLTTNCQYRVTSRQDLHQQLRKINDPLPLFTIEDQVEGLISSFQLKP